MKIWVAALVLLACAGCTKKEPRGPGRIVSLRTDVSGLSGLSADEHGALWAPGETADAVLRIDPATGGVTRYPVSGSPEGAELEAIAWVDETQFIVGTETQEKGRTRDVTPVGHLEYTLWRLTAPDNHGIEGLCYVDGVLVVATELVEERDGKRWAPVGLFETAVQSWTAHRVALTTDSGKLAALDCRPVDGAIEALAVERHFGVSRLLRFRLPKGDQPRSIEPRVVADLAALVEPLPNFEGLAWLKDGSAVLLTDNKYRGTITDPSRLYFVPASAMQ